MLAPSIISIKESLLQASLPIYSSRYEFIKSGDCDRSKPEMFPAGNGPRSGLDVYMHNLDSLPEHWIQYVHPDGKQYFRHPVWNVVTEANIRNPETCKTLEAWYDSVDSLTSLEDTKAPKTDEPGSIELCLTLGNPNSYYYVDHKHQTIFWLQDIPVSRLGFNIAGGSSIDLWLQLNYYSHLENFPCHKGLPADAPALLRVSLTYACVDHLTSYRKSTAPWNADDCQSILTLLDGLKFQFEGNDETPHREASAAYMTWFVARLLTVMLKSRVVHHYGMTDAYTYRRQLGQALPKIFSGVFGIIAGALSFWAHPTYVARLNSVLAGGIVSLSGWQDLLCSLLDEWSESSLLATVILSANMAFLALSDVGSIERTSSIISTFLSIGSMAAGLHHIWRHRVKKELGVEDVTEYLNYTDRQHLAFFLSIPLIFLLWSLVTFGCAVAVFAFSHSRPWEAYVFTGAVFGAVIYLIGHTVLFFMFAFRKGVDERQPL